MRMPTKVERHGFRDGDLSQRHRMWGWDAPVVDIDFLEYDHGEPVALFEYKFIDGGEVNVDHPSIRAMNKLATRAGLPAFLVVYDRKPWRFVIRPLNLMAGNRLGLLSNRECVEMDERAFVGLLYHLRGREAPQEVLAGLDGPRVRE